MCLVVVLVPPTCCTGPFYLLVNFFHSTQKTSLGSHFLGHMQFLDFSTLRPCVRFGPMEILPRDSVDIASIKATHCYASGWLSVDCHSRSPSTHHVIIIMNKSCLELCFRLFVALPLSFSLGEAYVCVSLLFAPSLLVSQVGKVYVIVHTLLPLLN